MVEPCRQQRESESKQKTPTKRCAREGEAQIGTTAFQWRSGEVRRSVRKGEVRKRRERGQIPSTTAKRFSRRKKQGCPSEKRGERDLVWARLILILAPIAVRDELSCGDAAHRGWANFATRTSAGSPTVTVSRLHSSRWAISCIGNCFIPECLGRHRPVLRACRLLETVAVLTAIGNGQPALLVPPRHRLGHPAPVAFELARRSVRIPLRRRNAS